ncbi:MAG TPA: hypothetical protein VF719_12260, partial [Abditibacteriaceae bacterium]
MATNIDIIVRVLQAATARNEIKNTGDETVRTGGKIKGAGENAEKAGQRFDKAGREVDEFGRHVKGAGNDATTARRSFGGLGDVLGTLGVAAAGAGMLAFSNRMRDAATEGDGLEARLEGLFKQQQRLADLPQVQMSIARIAEQAHLPDDDPLVEASIQMGSDGVQTQHLDQLLQNTARQAHTLKVPIEQVGEAMAKAYAEGSLSRLKRINILFTEQQEAAVAAAYGISAAAGQMAFMEAVTASTNQNAVALGEGLTGAQKAANDLARSGDEAMTAIGRGANNAQKEIDGMAGSVLGVVTQNPALLESAGYMGHITSAAMITGGTVLGVAASIGQVVTAWPMMA